MTAAARELSLLDVLVEWIAELLGEPVAQEQPAVGIPSLPESEVKPFRTFLAMARSVSDAGDHRGLRQACGTLALSSEYIDTTRQLFPVGQDEAPLERPSRDELAKRLAFHVAGPAASLLAEAFSLAWDMFGWLREHEAMPTTADLPAADVVAQLRRELVLGDAVPARVAEVVLASLRGEVAFLTAIAMLLARRRLDPWKAIGLGELAVDGMKATQRLVLPTSDRIDLDVEIQRYAAYKRDLVLRLESGEQD